MHSRTKIMFVALGLLGLLPARPAFAGDLKTVLDKLDKSAANFHSTSADVEFDTVTTDPLPDTDVQKGVVYYERKNSAVRMGVHLNQHNGAPSAKEYTIDNGVIKLFEAGSNQVTTYAKAGQFQGYMILAMGASGKDLAAKWDITDLGDETINGVKTEKLEMVAKDADVRKNLAKVTIWVDSDHAVSLKQVFTLSSTSSYVATYSNFKYNSSLPHDAFSFKTDKNTVQKTQ